MLFQEQKSNITLFLYKKAKFYFYIFILYNKPAKGDDKMNYSKWKKRAFIAFCSVAISTISLTGCGKKTNTFKYDAIHIEYEDFTNFDTSERKDIEISIDKEYDKLSGFKIVNSLKNIIAENEVGNIYLNLSDTLAYLEKEDRKSCLDYVKTICQKLTENGIKFTVIAPDNCLDELSDYSVLSCCSEKKELNAKKESYGSVYYNGKIYSLDENLDNIVNSTEGFVDDEVYIVESGDTLYDIATSYGIDYKELAKINGIDDPSLINVGQEIVIPWLYEPNKEEKEDTEERENIVEEEPEEEYEEEIEAETEIPESFKVDEELYYKGIDVSKYQGDINWEKAKDVIDFAFISLGDAYNKDEDGNYIEDPYYRFNMASCEKYNIKKGVYYYTRAMTMKEIEDEVKFVLDHLKDEDGNYYDIPLPISIDVEGECAEALNGDEETRKAQVERIQYFCEKMEEAGYATSVYINSNYISKIPEIVNIYSIWAAGGELAGYLYGEEQTFDEMYYGFSSEEDYFTSTYGINIIQTTECGDGEMVGVSSYYVDYNYAPRDFFDALYEKPRKSKGRTLKQ